MVTARGGRLCKREPSAPTSIPQHSTLPLSRVHLLPSKAESGPPEISACEETELGTGSVPSTPSLPSPASVFPLVKWAFIHFYQLSAWTYPNSENYPSPQQSRRSNVSMGSHTQAGSGACPPGSAKGSYREHDVDRWQWMGHPKKQPGAKTHMQSNLAKPW